MIREIVISLPLVVGLSIVFASAQDLSTQQLAERLCDKPKDTLISSVQSMTSLATYFKQLPAENHSLSRCRHKYLDSFVSIEKVLSVSNDNACSDEKISAIEDFHRKFLSTTRKDSKQQRKDHLKAPKAVKLFFMHYAFLVSSRCKHSLQDTLKETSFEIMDESGKPVDTEPFDALLEKFAQSFDMDIENRGYTDMILPWKLIDAYSIPKRSRRYVREPVIDAEHPVPIRVSVSMNGAQNLHSFQLICRSSFKPIYAELILPVIRLINLGLYENNSEPMVQALNANSHLRRMFGLAQLCETVLPIEAINDESLPEDKLVSLTVEKANKLRAQQPAIAPENLEQTVPVPSIQSVIGVDNLESLSDKDTAAQLVRALTKNRGKQEHTGKRLFHLASSAIKSQFRSDHSVRVKNGDGTITKIEIQDAPVEETLHRRKRLITPEEFFYGVIGVCYVISMAIWYTIAYTFKLIFWWSIKYSFKALVWVYEKSGNAMRKYYVYKHSRA